jgi:hypothetical protein
MSFYPFCKGELVELLIFVDCIIIYASLRTK